MTPSQTLKDLAAAYSLATLWHLVPWKELLFPGTNFYLAYDLPPSYRHLAIIANVAVLTLILLALISLARRSKISAIRSGSELVFIALGVLAFGPLSYELVKWTSPETELFESYLVPLTVCILCALPIVNKRFSLHSFGDRLRTIALLMLPFCLLVLAKSTAMQVFANSDFLQPLEIAESNPPAKQTATKSTRVVWIIFDELGFVSLSNAGKAGVRVSEFERLFSESFVAENAYAPADYTNEAIPSLLVGRKVGKVIHSSPSDALLYPDNDSEGADFRSSDNVFTDAAQLGKRSGIVGWFHPYSRLFQNQASYIYWRPIVDKRCTELSRFMPCALTVTARSLKTIPFVGLLLPEGVTDLGTEVTREDVGNQIERNDFLTAKAYELTNKRDLDLLFFHFSVPHRPYLALEDRVGPPTYLTSLEIADRILGEVRRRLEASGEWENTVLIVSSDHHRRWKEPTDFPFLPEEGRAIAAKDQRVPFVVRFPEHTDRLNYKPEVQTFLTRQIIDQIFKSQINSPQELSSWLEANASTSTE